MAAKAYMFKKKKKITNQQPNFVSQGIRKKRNKLNNSRREKNNTYQG